MRFAFCGFADARDRGGRDEPGLRYGAGWRVSAGEAVRISFGFLGAARLVQAAALGLDCAGAMGAFGHRWLSGGCWQSLAGGRGFGFAAGPSQPRMVDPSMGLGLRGALLAWSMGRGRGVEVGGEAPAGKRGRSGAESACLRPPSRSLRGTVGTAALSPSLRPRFVRVLGRAPMAATPASPSGRASAPVMTGEAPPVRTAP